MNNTTYEFTSGAGAHVKATITPTVFCFSVEGHASLLKAVLSTDEAAALREALNRSFSANKRAD